MGLMFRATTGVVLIAQLVIWLLIVILLKRSGRSTTYLLFFSIFYVYLCVLAGYALFPFYLGFYMPGFSIWNQLNLTPLTTLRRSDIRLSVLNVLMTVPFGFGIPFIAKMNIKKIIVVGLLLGVLIESLQLAQGLFLGFTTRIVDIDDVIFNFIGVIIGYGFFKLFKMCYDRLYSKAGITTNAIMKYIYDA